MGLCSAGTVSIVQLGHAYRPPWDGYSDSLRPMRRAHVVSIVLPWLSLPVWAVAGFAALTELDVALQRRDGSLQLLWQLTALERLICGKTI